jgi:hypothetical protein
MRWSTTPLGGAVATITQLAAMTVALTTGPTFYIAIAGDSTSQLSLVLGIVQFFLSVVAKLTFRSYPEDESLAIE